MNNWSQPIKGESDLQFKSFTLFRDAGPGRSHKAVAKEMKCAVQTVYNLSSRFSWNQRLRDYAAHLDQQRQEFIMDHQKKAAALEAEIEHRGMEIILENVKRLQRELDKDANYVIPAGALTQIYDMMSRAARAGRGKATDIVENPGDTSAELANIVSNVLKGMQDSKPQAN